MSTPEKVLNRAECSDEEMREKRAAFDYIVSHRKPYVGGDDKEELAQARDERFGKAGVL